MTKNSMETVFNSITWNKNLVSHLIFSSNGVLNKFLLTVTQIFTRIDSCSSPDLLDDADPNSNPRLDVRECSDDDNLDTLDRKVSAIVNGNRFAAETQLQTSISDNGNESDSGDILRVVSRDDELFRKAVTEMQFSVDSVDSVDSVEDVCESWSDEEGEVPGEYPSLRRRR